MAGSGVPEWLQWRRWPWWLFWGLIALAAAGFVVLIIWLLPIQLTKHPPATDRHKAISDTRTGLVAAVVAAGAAGGLAYTVRTYRLSQQGQFTDRYSKAVEQLGETKKVEVRLGGIYALERLMADSARDQPTILEVLAAWVRERTPLGTTPHPEKVATDIQAALTVIGRRTPVANERPIDLRRAVLNGAELSNARLEGANLSNAHLERANLNEADLKGADLTTAGLEFARLKGTHLEGANLMEAVLKAADLSEAHLEGANLPVANLESAVLSEAHLEGANLRHAHLERANLSNAHLERANLRFAHLERAFLGNAHLEGATAVDARFEGAYLYGAHLEGANLTSAHLYGAHLEGADLSEAKGLEQTQIDLTIVRSDTKLPEDLHPPGEPPPPVG